MILDEAVEKAQHSSDDGSEDAVFFQMHESMDGKSCKYWYCTGIEMMAMMYRRRRRVFNFVT
jgi:hypothetical protein